MTGGYKFGVTPVYATAELYDPATGMFTRTGSMTVPRSSHTATSLADGRVLVVGGEGNYDGATGYVDYASAEIYDPAAGTFSPTTGGMSVARISHTATLLPNGKVLVAGGYNHIGSQTNHASAEFYDPETASFTLTRSLVTPREGHVATPLADGSILITGGSALASAEVYDAVTDGFITRDIPRESHTATLLSDGRILIAGGSALVDARNALYDPSSRSFSPTGALVLPRETHTATLLKDGRVLISGGWNTSTDNLITPMASEVYDPTTGQFSTVGAPPAQRNGHTATLLSNGQVLLVGGRFGDVLASAELFDPAMNAYTATGPLAVARDEHTATLLGNGQVLVVGGRSATASLASAELFDPATKMFTPAGTLGTPRFGHSATLLASGHVLIIGGWSGTISSGAYIGKPIGSAELYDPATKTFTPAGALTTPGYDHAAVLLPSGKVLVLGGSNDLNPVVWGALHRAALARAELFDPATGTSMNPGMMNTPRDTPTATLLPDGDIVVVGGDAAYWNGNYAVALVEIFH